MTVRTSVDDSTELHLLGQPGAGSDSSVNSHQRRGSKRSYVAAFFRHTFDTLRPDILTRRKGPVKPIGPTAWLDGLRGWAAFNVAIVHLTVYTHDWAELCYGIELLPNYYLTSPITWPFIRLIFSGGHFAVMLFFHISGYVLTRRLVSMMHEGPSRHDEVVDGVHSAIVRRPFRLFLPVVWSTLTWAIIWHVTGIEIPWPEKQSNIIIELVRCHIFNAVSVVSCQTRMLMLSLGFLDRRDSQVLSPFQNRLSLYPVQRTHMDHSRRTQRITACIPLVLHHISVRDKSANSRNSDYDSLFQYRRDWIVVCGFLGWYAYRGD